MRAAGWRLLVTPAASTTHGLPYAIDNGAWGAHCQGIPWDEAAFERLVARGGAGADWIVLPDIVAGGEASLERSRSWVPWLKDVAPLLLPVQDGMEPANVLDVVRQGIGLFVGGSTAWKLNSLPMWAQLARAEHAYLHVARVNTARRIRLCQMAGADSFDGTSVTRYAVTLPELDEARRQEGLWRKRP